MIDCCSAPGLLPFEQAVEKILSSITPITEQKTVALEDALNCVLAQDIHSPLNVPPHNNSAMDGYAFAVESLTDSQTLRLAGRSMAGQPFQGVCQKGECIRIMTGAKMPAGCDTVEMQENCEVQTNSNTKDKTESEQTNITFLATKTSGSHVRKAGEDIKSGEKVLKSGHRLTAIDVGVLSSLGVAQVNVYRQLTVALIATGDELKKPGEKLTEGDIFESNSYVVSSILKKMNIKVLDFGIIEDNFDAIKQAFEQANEQADAIISSGGVSVGDADYTKDALDELGDIAFWKIAMKPGKPFAFGQLSQSVFFGLPGNPVSALVTFHQLAITGLLKLQNCDAEKPVNLKIKSTTALKKSPGRMDFQRGVLSINEQGETVVTSTGSQGSGILSSMARANCYIVLASNQGRVEAGEKVTVQLFDQYLQ